MQRSVEVFDLDMEVTEDNDYDCFPHYIPSNQEDKVLFGAKKISISEEILSENDLKHKVFETKPGWSTTSKSNPTRCSLTEKSVSQ
jgi:hypothetical protein